MRSPRASDGIISEQRLAVLERFLKVKIRDGTHTSVKGRMYVVRHREIVVYVEGSS